MHEEQQKRGELPPPTDYAEWRPSSSGKNRKCKAVDIETESKSGVTPSKRKQKVQPPQGTSDGKSQHQEGDYLPFGLIWDAVNHSCGYDATFTVLTNIWLRNPLAWSRNSAQ
ncbi:hypothetical protein B0H16DRAFT_1448480 [Mycena metata]|uniref:Uncharacterized protein n=1 Tax=Mycena metata TaxID=1033252 RepID=A0AAD7K5Q8_9AGAR|nr:hypothetical protein B0H16DRAFT_1448480 [Mycena metata]